MMSGMARHLAFLAAALLFLELAAPGGGRP